MRNGMRGKLSAYTIAAGAAALGIASVAHGQVIVGQVGDGIHVEFGPQDTNGQFLGVRTASYDPWVDARWYDVWPEPSGHTTPAGTLGYINIALNPYTGEVTTDVEESNRIDGPKISGPSGLPDDPGTPDVDESIISSAYVDTLTTPSTTQQDSLYFTTEIVDHSGKESHSFFTNTSSDGTVLPMKMGVGQEVRVYSGETYTTQRLDPETGEPMWNPNYPPGEVPILDYHYVDEGRVWGDPRTDHDDLGGNSREELYFYDDWFAVGGWWSWGGTGYIGFMMDGFAGWAKINISGARNGMWLQEYYFDAPSGRMGDFDGDGDIDAFDIDALGAAIQASSTDLAFDMDGDGFVTQADFDLHVETLVDTTLGEGTGSMFGDFNLDGAVDLLDLGMVGDQYGLGSGWATGDANGDGLVDLLDLGAVGDNYGFAVTPVPEPATLALLGMGAAGLVARRRRNK